MASVVVDQFEKGFIPPHLGLKLVNPLNLIQPGGGTSLRKGKFGRRPPGECCM